MNLNLTPAELKELCWLLETLVVDQEQFLDGETDPDAIREAQSALRAAKQMLKRLDILPRARFFAYTISVEVLTGAGYDTHTQVLEEGFIEAADRQEAYEQLTLLVPRILENATTWLVETTLADLPTPDDVDITVHPFDIHAECERTRRRIEAAIGEPPGAEDTHLEMEYEDRVSGNDSWGGDAQ